MSSEEESDGGYVHTPGGDADADADSESPADPEPFGPGGWVLVGAVVLAVLVIPGLIYLWPAAPTRIGAHFRFFMLVLPFLPALVLGLVAVWSMRAGR
ncbi:MAG: hypothetical protein ABEJ82_04965 [Haloplanus sp.]